MATFVLVPGSWLGGWVWRRVAPRLRDAGHDVHAITLTALGDRAHLGSGETDVSTHIQDVVATIEAEELTDVVLLGHSYAGVVVSGVAERIPDRIAKLIYLAGVLPVDGESFLDSAPSDFREYAEALKAEAGPAAWRFPVITDEDFAQYYGDHGIGAEDMAWLRRHAVGHPLGSYAEPLSGGAPAALPTTFIRCTEDAPPELTGPRAGWGYEEIETGHWPMISKPAELAALLDRTARG